MTAADDIDPAETGPYQQVKCADCGRIYECTPMDDHYLVAGEPEGSPRVCEACLLARHGLRHRQPPTLN